MMTEKTTAGETFLPIWNDASEEEVIYTRLSVPALLSTVFGLMSLLAFITPWFSFFGILGIVFALWAIAAISKAEGSLTGLLFARIGLSGSVITLVAVAVLWPSYQYGVRFEANQFFRIWFEALRQNNIPLAKGLNSFYWERPETDKPEEWWQKQYENNFTHRSIHSFVDSKLVRVLLALGDKADVSYYKTIFVTTSDNKDFVVILYAVSYPTGDGKTETFFVKMVGKREFPRGDVKSAGWVLDGYPAFIVPDEFNDKFQKE
jgi:hypothetical protein